MPQSAATSIERLPAAVVVHVLSNQLTSKSHVDTVCNEIDKAQFGDTSTPFILDLANVEFMGSLAIGTLVGLHKEFHTRGQRLIFAAFQSSVQQSLSIAKLDRVLEIMPSVPAALQNLGAVA
jgi:anti-anti-sigma factor